MWLVVIGGIVTYATLVGLQSGLGLYLPENTLIIIGGFMHNQMLTEEQYIQSCETGYIYPASLVLLLLTALVITQVMGWQVPVVLFSSAVACKKWEV